MGENSLIIFTQAAKMLAEADTIQKTKELKDLALTAADWAKRKSMGEEAIKYANSYALEAERKMGQLIKQGQEVNIVRKPGRYSNSTTGEELKIGELGLTWRESAEAQKLAEVSDEVFSEIREGNKSKSQVLKEIKQIERKVKVEAQKEQIKTLTKPDGLYDVIVIDPPWEIKGNYDPDSRRATPDYPMMSYAEIADIKLPASENCILWLWVTNLDLHEGFHLIEKWGFEYKNVLTWAKDKFGLGMWMRGQTEHCLLAIKGKPLFTGESISTLLNAPGMGHSIKPEAFYELVDKCCYGRKLDYFGGKERNGWDRYGAQRVSL